MGDLEEMQSGEPAKAFGAGLWLCRGPSLLSKAAEVKERQQISNSCRRLRLVCQCLAGMLRSMERCGV